MLELQAQQEFFEKQDEEFHDYLKKKIHLLEQHVHILEGNESNVPSKKARSESTSPTPPIHKPPLPLDKQREAKLQGIEAISTCLEQQIDAQIIFLEWHIEQLQSASTKLHQLQVSNDHMMGFYQELSWIFCIQDEQK